jgi:hypothetical protein
LEDGTWESLGQSSDSSSNTGSDSSRQRKDGSSSSKDGESESDDPMASLGLSTEELRRLPRDQLLDILQQKIKQYGLSRRQQLRLANQVYRAKKHMRRHPEQHPEAAMDLSDDWPSEEEMGRLFAEYGLDHGELVLRGGFGVLGVGMGLILAQL